MAALRSPKGNPIQVVVVAKRVLAELDALGDGSADSIYLGDPVVNRAGRATGRPGRSGRHVVCLEFGNSRCDGSWGGQIGSGPGGGTAESAEDLGVARSDLAVTLRFSDSGIREVTEAWGVRSDLAR